MKKFDQLTEKLKDNRSMEVIFISHCLLNINTRYLGGAFRRSSVNEVIMEAMEKGMGIIQIKCPEQYAWGGVLKRIIWLPFDSKNSFAYFFRRFFIPLFVFYTHLVYRKIAISLIADIYDYIKSGFTVRGIIGVDGSPSCGVYSKLDMKKSFEFYASNKIDNVNRDRFNHELYEKCLENGSGIFLKEIKKQMKKRNLQVPVYAHNLISEMQGEACKIRL